MSKFHKAKPPQNKCIEFLIVSSSHLHPIAYLLEYKKTKQPVTPFMFVSPSDHPSGGSQRQRQVPVPTRQVLRRELRHRRQVHPVWPPCGRAQAVDHVEVYGDCAVCQEHREHLLPSTVSCSFLGV